MSGALIPSMPVRFFKPQRVSACLLGAGLLLAGSAVSAAEGTPVRCRMNAHTDTCLITPAPRDGFQIRFQGGDQAIFVFTPAGAPTTLNRPMKDAQGRTWLMTGHHSFTLREVGGFGNVIEVTAP